MTNSNKLSLFLLLIALAIGSYLYYTYRIPHGVDFNKLQLANTDGSPFNFSDTKGQYVYVNFFATWCGPCVQEFPDLENMAEKYSAKGLKVICISDEPVKRLQGFSKRYSNQLHFVKSVQSLKSLQIATIPTNYFLLPDGKVVYQKVGVPDWAAGEIDSLIHNHLR